EDHGAQREEAGVDAVAVVGDLEVELQSEPPHEVIDGALVAIDDGVHVVQLQELEPVHSHHHIWTRPDFRSHRLSRLFSVVRRPKPARRGEEGGPLAASPWRLSTVASSRAAFRSGSSGLSAAEMLPANCSGRLAPTMGAVTAGWATPQLTATVVSDRPADLARSRMCSTVSNSSACQYRSWYIVPARPSGKRLPSGGAPVRSCLPVNRPPASGLYGMTPTPSSSHSGSSSRSTWRNSRL